MEKKLVVDEGGNKRTEISDDDIKQAITDISQWFMTNAKEYYASSLEENKGNKEEDVAFALKLFGAESSNSLKIALLKYNGGFQYLDSYVGITLEEIQKVGASKDLYPLKIVPFAKDLDGQFLCVQINPALKHGETLITWDSDEKEVIEDFKQSFGEYLEQIRDGLLSKKLFYEDELGLVSIQ